MVNIICHGREGFEELFPFGSEKNLCPFGFATPCAECRFYRIKEQEVKS